jgi:hypothetical protein
MPTDFHAGDWAGLRRQIRADSAMAVTNARRLRKELDRLSAAAKASIADSKRLREQLWRNQARSRAALRAGRDGRDSQDDGFTWFVVHGLIDGYPVWGSWAAGELLCNPLLIARAQLLVDLEESFVFEDPPRCLAASLEDPPVAVALTLIRACDRAISIDVSTPDALR